MAPKATRMIEQRELLKVLHKTHPKLRMKLLSIFPKEMMHLLSECALNILKGTVVLKKNQKKKLRPHRSKLHTLASKKGNKQTREKIVQTGGFLSALLGPILEATLEPLVKTVVPTIFGALTRGG